MGNKFILHSEKGIKLSMGNVFAPSSALETTQNERIFLLKFKINSVACQGKIEIFKGLHHSQAAFNKIFSFAGEFKCKLLQGTRVFIE